MIILLFGRLADILGREVALSLPQPCTVADVRRELARLHPASAAELAASRARAFIGDAMAREDAVVRDGDEVAFFPPLSGG